MQKEEKKENALNWQTQVHKSRSALLDHQC